MTDLRNWAGNIEEFADKAGELLKDLGRTDERPPTIRLIRDYIQRGLLGDVPLRGRDLIFGYDQLVRFAAARVLLADGWPRAKIREYFAVSSREEIEALVPGLGEVAHGDAGRAGRRRRAGVRVRRPGRKASTTDQRAGFRERTVSLSAVHAELFATLDRLGILTDEPAREEMTRFSIAPWCELFVDTRRLAEMTLGEAQDVGRAITGTLVVALMRKQELDHHG